MFSQHSNSSSLSPRGIISDDALENPQEYFPFPIDQGDCCCSKRCIHYTYDLLVSTIGINGMFKSKLVFESTRHERSWEIWKFLFNIVLVLALSNFFVAIALCFLVYTILSGSNVSIKIALSVCLSIGIACLVIGQCFLVVVRAVVLKKKLEKIKRVETIREIRLIMQQENVIASPVTPRGESPEIVFDCGRGDGDIEVVVEEKEEEKEFENGNDMKEKFVSKKTSMKGKKKEKSVKRSSIKKNKEKGKIKNDLKTGLISKEKK